MRYLAHTPDSTLFFTADGIVLTLANAECGVASAGDAPGVARVAAAGAPAVVRLQWVGAAPVAPVAGEPLRGRVNLSARIGPGGVADRPGDLWGADLRRVVPWHHLAIQRGRRAAQRDLSPGGGRRRGTIRWRYECGLQIADCGIALAGDGSLQIRVGAATLTEAAPVAWQERGGRRTAVTARYVVGADGSVGFALGAYDRALPLVIDPTLSYSSFLGGSGAEWAYGVTVDAAGNIYMVGETSSTDFPTANAYQPQNGGEYRCVCDQAEPQRHGADLLDLPGRQRRV